MTIRSKFCIAAIALGLSAPTQIQAGVTGIRMFVPTFCQAAIVSADAPQEGEVRPIGLLREACNNAGGYAVVIQHPEGLHDAYFVLSGEGGVERIPVSESGFTILTSSNAPGRRARQLSLEVGDSDAQLAWISVSTITG